MATLIQRARNGEGEAFISLMEAHKVNMYKVARAYLSCEADVADVMQQTILDCFEKLHTLKKDAFFKTWMTRILINNCNDVLRQNKRVCPIDSENALWEDIAKSEPEEDLMEFLDTLNQLDERYRKVLVLFYVEELPVKEIARLLQCRESTVNTWLRRGRLGYRKLLEQTGT